MKKCVFIITTMMVSLISTSSSFAANKGCLKVYKQAISLYAPQLDCWTAKCTLAAGLGLVVGPAIAVKSLVGSNSSSGPNGDLPLIPVIGAAILAPLLIPCALVYDVVSNTFEVGKTAILNGQAACNWLQYHETASLLNAIEENSPELAESALSTLANHYNVDPQRMFAALQIAFNDPDSTLFCGSNGRQLKTINALVLELGESPLGL